MEPWPFSHGYVRCRRCRFLSSTLQWSHGPSAMDTRSAELQVGDRVPSMEPWPFSHGYIPRGAPYPEANPSFNGAMALQPWIPDAGARFRPARLDLQWSHGPSAMDTVDGRTSPRHLCNPSMEPWPFSHGYTSLAGRSAARSQSFNGAMALQPWIPSPPTFPIIIICCLQWSHGPSAMDTALPFLNVSARHLPSMEPWPFSHGYLVRDGKLILAEFLQWSHGPSAMDTIPNRFSRDLDGTPSMEPWPFSHGYSTNGFLVFSHKSFLQWSHGPSAMDTSRGVA